MTATINHNHIGDQAQTRLTPEEINELVEELDELERFDAGLMTVEERSRFLAKLCADEEKCRMVSDMFDLGILSLPEDDEIPQTPEPQEPPVAETRDVGLSPRWSDNPRVLRRLLTLTTSICLLCVFGALYYSAVFPREIIARAEEFGRAPLVRIIPAPTKNVDVAEEIKIKEKENEDENADVDRQMLSGSDVFENSETRSDASPLAAELSQRNFNNRTEKNAVVNLPADSSWDAAVLESSAWQAWLEKPTLKPRQFESGTIDATPEPCSPAMSLDDLASASFLCAPTPPEDLDATGWIFTPCSGTVEASLDLAEIAAENERQNAEQKSATSDGEDKRLASLNQFRLQMVSELLCFCEFSEAREEWERLPRSLKDGFDGKTSEGILLYFEGKRDEAERALREASEMAPNNPFAKRNLEFVRNNPQTSEP